MNDSINVKVGGVQDIIRALQNYNTIILKPNIVDNRNVLTQEMIYERHTKYVIRWNYSLEGATINVPEDCIIEFDGGTINNGTIVGNNTIMIFSKPINEVCPAERQGTFIYNTTVADEEDITSESGQLKFKDRPASSGMGRKILRKNIIDGVNTLNQNMINQANTIYIIQYDFTLSEDITIPVNCVLEFAGGSISGSNNNDTITLNNTKVIGNVLLYNVKFDGIPLEYNINSFPGETYIDKLENALNSIYSGIINCYGTVIEVTRPLNLLYETIEQDSYTKDYRRIRIIGATFIFSSYALFENYTYDLMTPLFDSCSFIGKNDDLYVYDNLNVHVIGMMISNCYFKRMHLVHNTHKFAISLHMNNCDIFNTTTTFIEVATSFDASFFQNRFEGGHGSICIFSSGANPSNFIFDSNVVEGRFSGTVFKTGGGINFVISNNYFEEIHDGLLELRRTIATDLKYDFKIINNYWENRNIITTYGVLLYKEGYTIDDIFKDTVFANNSIFFKEGQSEAIALRGKTFKNKGLKSTENYVENGTECYSESGMISYSGDNINWQIRYNMGSFPVNSTKDYYAPCILVLKGKVTGTNSIKSDVYLLTFDVDSSTQEITVNPVNIGGTTNFIISAIRSTNAYQPLGVYVLVAKSTMETCESYIINTAKIAEYTTANNL